jgi:hypothetical protein
MAIAARQTPTATRPTGSRISAGTKPGSPINSMKPEGDLAR